MSDESPLTEKQAAFVREYLLDLNATRAAIRAGYSAKGAAQTASDLLRIPKVSEAVDEAIARRAAKAEVKAEDVLRELMRLATVDIGEAFDEAGAMKPLKEMSPEVRRAISAIEVDELWEGRGEDRVRVGDIRKVKLWDKRGALELLGKHLKMFSDRVEHEHTVSIRVVDPYAKTGDE